MHAYWRRVLIVGLAALVMGLFLPLPAHSLGVPKPPKEDPMRGYMAFHRGENGGWIRLSHIECPKDMQSLIPPEQRDKTWRYGHSYVASDKTVYRLCWTVLMMNDDLRKGAFAAMVYTDGDRGLMPLTAFTIEPLDDDGI
jgi:hypothetical protein